MVVAGYGISVDVPTAWEARIYRRGGAAPVMHLASFALRESDGDFGAAATGRMRPGDVFVALVEYVTDARLRPGSGLFAASGLPSVLRPQDFSPFRLQVTRAGQVGMQRFFTAGGRPCCLYVVICHGATTPEAILTGIRRVLSTVKLSPAPSPPA